MKKEKSIQIDLLSNNQTNLKKTKKLPKKKSKEEGKPQGRDVKC